MSARATNDIAQVIAKHENAILSEWVDHQSAAITLRRDLLNDTELRAQSKRFLNLLAKSLHNGGIQEDLGAQSWADMREFLSEVSTSRARQGFSPSETATFVFSLKQPLFEQLRA